MDEQPAGDRASGRAMTALARQGGTAMRAAILLPLLAGMLLPAQAWVLADALHRAIVDGAARETLVPSIALLGGLFLLRAALNMAAERCGIAAAEGIKARLRAALFARLLAKDTDWIAARPSGALMTAIVDQIETLDGFVARFMPAMIQASLLPLAFAVLVMPVDWFVGLLFLVTAPLIPLFMALVGWGAEAASRDQAQATARLSGLFADRLRGLLTLKLFGQAGAETARVVDAGEALRRNSLIVLRIAFLSSAVLEFFAALGVAGVALYVGLGHLGLLPFQSVPLTLQAGLFCLLMAPEVYQPLRLMAAHYHDRAAAKAAIAEITALFETLPALEADRAPPAPALARIPDGAVGLDLTGVTIRVPGSARIILKDVALTVPAGTHVALLGESGTGKSSLLAAIARLRQAEGDIRLGGVPLAEIGEDELRRRVAWLGPRPRLFHGTIADNIRLGRPDADDGALHAAAALAQVGAFADRLPRGLDTPVGDGGTGLSGGEAHRVALARIFLRAPDLILLDEPTAHLDAATEAAVLDGLLAFAAGRTLVVATHAATVAARMDRAWRVAGGMLLPTPAGRQRRSGPPPRQGLIA